MTNLLGRLEQTGQPAGRFSRTEIMVAAEDPLCPLGGRAPGDQGGLMERIVAIRLPEEDTLASLGPPRLKLIEPGVAGQDYRQCVRRLVGFRLADAPLAGRAQVEMPAHILNGLRLEARDVR